MLIYPSSILLILARIHIVIPFFNSGQHPRGWRDDWNHMLHQLSLTWPLSAVPEKENGPEPSCTKRNFLPNLNWGQRREYGTAAKNCLFINLPTCYPTFPLTIQPLSGMCGILIRLLCHASFEMGLLWLIQSERNKSICNICLACCSQTALFEAQKSTYT